MLKTLSGTKKLATALFCLACLGYIGCLTLTDSKGGFGYLSAFCEAAMVGALADWFAVTALFRHPLGLPIPHTAIVAKRKDEIGRSLGEFVETNFLQPSVLGPRLESAQMALRGGQWLGELKNRQSVANLGLRLLGFIVSGLDDKNVAQMLTSVIKSKATSTKVAPLIGKTFEYANSHEKSEQAISSILSSSSTALVANKEILRKRFLNESPWWVPPSVDGLVFERLFDGLSKFLDEIANDEGHEFRQVMTKRLSVFAHNLQFDQDLIEKGEKIKADLLSGQAVNEIGELVWRDIKAALGAQIESQDSELAQKFATIADSFGQQLRNDKSYCAKIDLNIQKGILSVLHHGGKEISNLIANTVERWDTNETVERFESQIGRDLQFIRINGTIVGGLAGLIIHALHVIFL